MVMKGCSAFPKAPALLKLHHQTCLALYRTLFVGGGSYPSAEKQSVNSTAPDDWVIDFCRVDSYGCIYIFEWNSNSISAQFKKLIRKLANFYDLNSQLEGIGDESWCEMFHAGISQAVNTAFSLMSISMKGKIYTCPLSGHSDDIPIFSTQFHSASSFFKRHLLGALNKTSVPSRQNKLRVVTLGRINQKR